MAVKNESYELEILEYAVNQCIDILLPTNSEDALSVILDRSNEVVWKVATDIYTKSGYQVDFSFVKDVLNLRIEPLRNKIAEEARIRAELEAQRLAREIEEARIRKEQEAEKAKIRAKLKAERLAKKAEEERIRKEKEVEKEKIRKQQEEIRQKKLEEFSRLYPNVSIDIFLRIERIIAEELLLEEERITLDSILGKDLGADSLDVVELIQAIEEEFDIEIPDNFTGVNWISCCRGDYSRLESITVKEIVDLVCEKIQ